MRIAACKALLKEDKETLTTWMRFYLSVYFPIQFLYWGLSVTGFLVNLPSMFILLQQGDWNSLLLRLPSNVFVSVAGIFAYIHMRELSVKGYKWNLVYLWCSFADFICYSLIRVMPDLGPLTLMPPICWVLLVLLIYALAWLLPNLIYFKKRKHLFRPYTQLEIEKALRRQQSKQMAGQG